MVTVICFLDDVLQAFKEAYRVLKPGGYILVGFIDKESVLGRQYMEKREKSLFYQDAVFLLRTRGFIFSPAGWIQFCNVKANAYSCIAE